MASSVLFGISFTIVSLTTLYFFLWFKKRHYYALIGKLPGPKPLPIIGNLDIAIKTNFGLKTEKIYRQGRSILRFTTVYQGGAAMMWVHPWNRNPYQVQRVMVTYDSLKFLDAMKGYGGLFTIWMGNDPAVFITKSEYLETFYKSSALLDRAVQYEVLEDLLGKGNLVTAEGDEWRKARKVMKNTFHVIPLETHFKTILEQSTVMMKKLEEAAKNGPFEFLPYARRNQTAIITRIALDEDAYAYDDLVGLADCFERVLETVLKRIISPIHYFNLTFRFTKERQIFLKNVDNLRSIMEKYIRKKKKELEEIEEGKEVPNVFIFNLLRKHGDEPMSYLISQLFSIYAAGVDTSSHTACFILIMLAMHPEIQEKVYQEDLTVQQDLQGKEITLQDMQNYTYLDSVIKETLRLYPASPVQGRCTTEDVRFGEYLVPKGTDVMIAPFITHRDEKIFPKPMEFNPDRFFLEDAERLNPYVYEPFSSGQRKCTGYKFALAALKISVSSIIRRFNVYTDYKSIDDLEPNLVGNITMAETSHALLRFEERIKNI